MCNCAYFHICFILKKYFCFKYRHLFSAKIININYLTFTHVPDINHGTFAFANGYTVGQSLHANQKLTTSPWKPVREFPTFLKLHTAFLIKTRIS